MGILGIFFPSDHIMSTIYIPQFEMAVFLNHVPNHGTAYDDTLYTKAYLLGLLTRHV